MTTILFVLNVQRAVRYLVCWIPVVRMIDGSSSGGLSSHSQSEVEGWRAF